MKAVIKTGGKQYLVSPGDKIKIEKLKMPATVKAKANKDESKEIKFADVLLIQKDKKLELGAPLVKNAKVIAKILKQGKGKKIVIFKYKSKKRYKKKTGHRQPCAEVEIIKLFSAK